MQSHTSSHCWWLGHQIVSMRESSSFVSGCEPVDTNRLLTSDLIRRSLHAAGCSLVGAIGFIGLATLPPEAYLVCYRLSYALVSLLDVFLARHRPSLVERPTADCRPAPIRYARHVRFNRLCHHATSTVVPRLKHPLNRLYWTCSSAQCHARWWSRPSGWCLDI